MDSQNCSLFHWLKGYCNTLYFGFILFGCISNIKASAQADTSLNNQGIQSYAGIIFDFNRDLQEQLPPLDSLFAIARAYSPMLDKYQSFSIAQKEKIALARKSWSTHIQLQGNYALGNQSLLLSGSAVSDLNQLSNGYRVGVNLGLPVFEFYTRHNRIKLAEAEAKASEDQLAEAGMLVDKEVATAYYQLLTAFKQLKNTQLFVDKTFVSELNAEMKFKQNQLSVTDYTRVSEIKTAWENQKLETERVFYNAYYSMQIVLGIPLIQLKR